MKKIILICGLIRKIDILYKSIDIYIKLREEKIIDEIVICTDKYIHDNLNGNIINDTLRLHCNKNNIKIIEHETLNIEHIEHIDPIVKNRPICPCRKKNNSISLWREIYNVKIGLENLIENSFVLKTRTDCFLTYDIIKKIFTNYLIKLEDNSILNYKIWAPSFRYAEQLFITDYMFAGYRNDLLKTTKLDGSILEWGNKSPTGFNNMNTIWWIYLFKSNNSIIQKYVETYVNSNTEIKTYKEDLYYSAIANYFYLLDKYFIIDSGYNDITMYPSWGGSGILNSSDNTLEFNNHCNSNWINNFKKKLFNYDLVLNQIYNKFILLS